MRGVLTSIGIFLIVVGVGLLFGKPRAEDALRRSIQTEMTEAFGVPVTVAKVRVSLIRRAIRAEGVLVASPAQFREEPALMCDEVGIKVDPLTLVTGTPVFHRVDVKGAILNYRYKVGTGTNIGMLTSALDEYIAENPGARRYEVKLLECTGAKVNFSTNLIPLAKVGMRVVNVRRESVDQADPLSSIQITRVFIFSVLKEAITLNGITDPIVDELKELFD